MQCFYVPGSSSIIDTINPETGKSFILGETLEETQERHPAAEVWELDAAVECIHKRIYQTSITPPKEIAAERFEEMLNIMPPMRWRSGYHDESFMVCEPLTLDIHSIFCRIGERYFELCDRRSLTHQEILSKCQPLITEG